MTHNQVVEKLLDWMRDFVEAPHPSLGNFSPCPFARKARLDNKIAILESLCDNLMTTVDKNLYQLDNKEVLIIWFDHNQINYRELADLVVAHNKILMPQDYVILEDHPDAEELVNGVKMNFGYSGLLVVQKLSKLNTASEQLMAKGYYAHWDKLALDEVVTWRTK